MASPIAPDRKLAADVRRLGLGKIKKLFEMAVVEMTQKEKEMHDELLIRMAPSFVPRLNEHSGEDGGPILIGQITGMEIIKDGNKDNSKQDPISDQEREANTSS